MTPMKALPLQSYAFSLPTPRGHLKAQV